MKTPAGDGRCCVQRIRTSGPVSAPLAGSRLPTSTNTHALPLCTRVTPGNVESDGARGARTRGSAGSSLPRAAGTRRLRRSAGGGSDRRCELQERAEHYRCIPEHWAAAAIFGGGEARLDRYSKVKETPVDVHGEAIGSRPSTSSPSRDARESMQSQAHGSEPGRAPAKRKQRRPAGHEDPDDDDEEERRKKTQASALRGLLRDFFEQQLRLDERRQEMMERQAMERRFFEEQWRQAMQRMERERLMLEQAWAEREEQRRMREEARAERRDALLTSLLTRLLHGDL